MIAAFIILSVLGSSECIKSSRDEPVVMIVNNSKHHFIHLLKGEDKLCTKLVTRFNAKKLLRVCGCKHLINSGERDTIRLKCAHVLSDNHVISKTVSVYYYYDDDVSLSACKKARNKIMKDGKIK